MYDNDNDNDYLDRFSGHFMLARRLCNRSVQIL